jgi:ABC-type glycerol-3-phosphate transport system substrate-binding protein
MLGTDAEIRRLAITSINITPRRTTMFTKMLRITALTLPLVIGTVACGSDDDSTPATTAAATDEPAATAAPSGDDETSGSNPEVEAYCTEVDEFVEANQQMLEDPASVDVEAITQQSLDLIAAATALATSTDGDDAARLAECSEKFAEVGS